MYAHPGKKLMFMGAEFAQGREWNYDHSLDWHLAEYPMHAGIKRFVRISTGPTPLSPRCTRSTSTTPVFSGSTATTTRTA